MRALVTGATGFVGTYLTAALQAQGDDVFACSGPHDTIAFPLDLGDVATIRAALDLARPDVIVHLAAQTFVPDSLQSPKASGGPHRGSIYPVSWAGSMVYRTSQPVRRA